MRILVKTAGMSREEWLSWRRNGIGGSEAAALVGLHPYLSPFAVYMDKIGQPIQQEDNEKMRLGRDLEGYVASRFTERTGIYVRRKSCILMDDEYDFMIADIDRWSKKDGVGLECKTMSPNSEAAGALEDNSVPPQYYVQCQWYMMITGLPVWHLAVLVLGKGFYTFEIERNDEDIEALRAAAIAFWQDYVIPRRIPAPDGSDSAQAAVVKLSGAVDNDASINLPQGLDRILELDEINNEIESLKLRSGAIKQEILLSLDGAGEGRGDGYLVRARTQTRRVFDVRRFRKENPDIDLAPYYNESISRPFKYTIYGQ